MTGPSVRRACKRRGVYRYQIREVATGRTVVREYESAPTRSDFFWLEGNYSCDCNRELEFDRALGQERDHSSYTCNLGPNAYVFDWVELDGVRFIENDRPTEHARW